MNWNINLLEKWTPIASLARLLLKMAFQFQLTFIAGYTILAIIRGIAESSSTKPTVQRTQNNTICLVFGLVNQTRQYWCSVNNLATSMITCLLWHVTRAYIRSSSKWYNFLRFEVFYHDACASNLSQDLIAAKVSCGIPKQSDWSIMMS